MSAISTFRLDLAGDLEFWAAHGIDCVGVSVAKLDAFGWDEGIARIVDSGVRVGEPDRRRRRSCSPTRRSGNAQRERLVRALEPATRWTPSASCSRPARRVSCRGTRPPTRSRRALAPVLVEARALGIPFAVEHTNSLRVDVGFVHSLHDVVDLARRLGTGVCMEINACWAERGLAATIAAAMDVIRLVQVSDFSIGTLATPDRLVPGDGDIPIERIARQVLAAGYEGVFDLELIGPKIDAEGYESAVPARGRRARLSTRPPRRLRRRATAPGRRGNPRSRRSSSPPPGQPVSLSSVQWPFASVSSRSHAIGASAVGACAGIGERRGDRGRRSLREVLPEDRVHHDGRDTGGGFGELRGHPLDRVGAIDRDGERRRDREARRATW